MPAFNIAANQQLAQPVSSFFQGKAMAIAEKNQARKMEIEEERLVREREAFELDTRLAESQEKRAATAFDQGTKAHEMQMDASELEFMQKSFSDPITNNMLKEQFAKLKTLPPEDRAAEFYAAVGKENPQLAKFLAKYDDDGVVDDKEIDKFVSTLNKYLPDSEKEDFTLGPDQVRFDAGGRIIASNPKAADKDPDFIKKNKYYKNVLENQDNFTPEEIAQANRHFLGSGQKVTITTDEFGNAQVTIAEGTNELTTSTASKVQQEIIAAQTSLDELDGMLQKDWSEVPPWAYGSTGEFTQKISAVFQQLDLPFKKWVKGTLNPSDAVEMRTQSIIFGGKVISMVTGETGRFTDKERELAFKAAGVMTSPNSEPEQVLTAMQTVRPLLVNYLERRQRALVEGMDDTELEMERLRSEIKQMGGAPDA